MSRTTLAVGAVALSLALAACSGGSDGSGSKEYADGGTFTMALASDPGNLDPSMTPSTVTRSMLALSYDTLVFLEEDGTVVSGLAEEWDATINKATFTLKEGITCSDGSELTATDVADNIDYIADPDNQSPLNGVMAHAGIKTVADDAARTVTVKSPDDNGFLLTELSGIFIICRAGLDDHDALAAATIGTGPWQLDDAVAGDHYSFTPNADYVWGPDGASLEDSGTPETVDVRILTSGTTAANLVLSGEVNYASVGGSDAQRLDSADLTTIDTINTAGETWFNQDAGRPGADRAVREALTVGTNRTELAKVATGGQGQESKGFITLAPNPCAGGDTVQGNLPDYDVDQAKQVLDDAGWTLNADDIRVKDGKELKVAFKYDAQGLSARTAGAEYLASEWEKLGVDVDLQALPEAQLNDRFFNTGAWDVAWAPFTFNLPSQMVAFVSGPTPTDGGANFPHIDNPSYDAAAAKATPQVGDAGCDDWADAEEALLADFNLVPMFDDVLRTYVSGAEVNAPGGQVWGSSIRLVKN